MPEGVKLSDKSKSLHKHVGNYMCYLSTIAGGQLVIAFPGGREAAFFLVLMEALGDVAGMATGHFMTQHMPMILMQKGHTCVKDQSQAKQPRRWLVRPRNWMVHLPLHV